jgi:predicted aspartyl protease
MLRQLVLFSAVLICGVGAGAQTAKFETISGVPDIDKTTQTEDVRFRNARDDRMTVAVRLSGEGPYQFLVDTGADRTAVSRELVDKLNLQKAAGAELHSVTGVSSVSTAKIPNLELTRTPTRSIEAAVLDRANMGADGIVGVDLLRSQRVQFDFQSQTMSIVPSYSPDFRYEPGTIVVEARRKNGRLVVTDAVVDGTDVTVVLDTGSQITIGNQALHDRLRRTSLVDGLQKVDLVSVTGGVITGDYMFVRDLTIGGIGLSHLAVVFTNAHTFKQLGLERKPALLLGMNAIRAFKKVSIDFANRKFRVVLPERSALDTQLASAGLP